MQKPPSNPTKIPQIPGLYLSNITPPSTPQTLHSLKITHILSLGAAPSTPTTLGLAHKVISINDNPYEDLLRELDDACEFISGALDRNGKDGEEENNVLVHCHQGISRSASVVIAYMMRVLRMSYEDALAAVVEVRPIVAPNEGFARQLGVWGRMGCYVRNEEGGEKEEYLEWKRGRDRVGEEERRAGVRSCVAEAAARMGRRRMGGGEE